MRLYYRARTGRPVRVAWALEEIGVDYEPVVLSADECRDDAHRQRQLHAFTRAAAAVGDQLTDQPFLLGDALTAADIVLGGVLAVSRFAGVLDAAPVHVADYLDRLQARAAYTRAAARTESLLAGR